MPGPAPPSHTSPCPCLPSAPRSPFTTPSQFPQGSCSPCPAPQPSPGSAPPSAPLRGSRCPRSLWGVPLSPPALPCVGTPRLTHESPSTRPQPRARCLCSHGCRHPPSAPWARGEALALALCPGHQPHLAAREEEGASRTGGTRVTATSPHRGHGPVRGTQPRAGGDPPQLQTALARILRPSGNTGLVPAWVDTGKGWSSSSLCSGACGTTPATVPNADATGGAGTCRRQLYLRCIPRPGWPGQPGRPRREAVPSLG